MTEPVYRWTFIRKMAVGAPVEIQVLAGNCDEAYRKAWEIAWQGLDAEEDRLRLDLCSVVEERV